MGEPLEPIRALSFLSLFFEIPCFFLCFPGIFASGRFSNLENFQGKKKHININKFAGLSRVWVGAKILFMCFFSGSFLIGEKKHINKVPPKIPEKSREIFVYVFFSLCFFWHPQACVYPDACLRSDIESGKPPPSWGKVSGGHPSPFLFLVLGEALYQIHRQSLNTRRGKHRSRGAQEMATPIARTAQSWRGQYTQYESLDPKQSPKCLWGLGRTSATSRPSCGGFKKALTGGVCRIT